jgi:hypothetical protein
VCHWLAQAHAHGSDAAYRAWLDEQPVGAGPYRRVRAQAEMVVWDAPQDGPGDRPMEAWVAGRDAVFLLDLVAVLNERAESLLGPGFLRGETLEAELRLLWLEVRSGVSPVEGSDDGTCAERWMNWCSAYATSALILGAAEAARTQLEDRYIACSRRGSGSPS